MYIYLNDKAGLSEFPRVKQMGFEQQGKGRTQDIPSQDTRSHLCVKKQSYHTARGQGKAGAKVPPGQGQSLPGRTQFVGRGKKSLFCLKSDNPLILLNLAVLALHEVMGSTSGNLKGGPQAA